MPLYDEDWYERGVKRLLVGVECTAASSKRWSMWSVANQIAGYHPRDQNTPIRRPDFHFPFKPQYNCCLMIDTREFERKCSEELVYCIVKLL